MRDALAEAGADPSEIDLVICATVTPDMLFPTTSALMADALGMRSAAAYDLLAGCTGFMYAVARRTGCWPRACRKKALVVGGDLLSKILDWDDRSTLVLFGDGAGAVVMERVDAAASSASSSARTAAAASTSAIRGAGRGTSTTPMRS